MKLSGTAVITLALVSGVYHGVTAKPVCIDGAYHRSYPKGNDGGESTDLL